MRLGIKPKIFPYYKSHLCQFYHAADLFELNHRINRRKSLQIDEPIFAA